ncbi:hypothetical protein AAG94_07065 [Escherichia albertii]|uniref:hypothetical protein n=1 Tax=Escherichia albertii TaxID=208962 RepID=UPI000A874C1B|nr:hypothetical protein [Escherichia albertii]EEW0114803.1 hypothetical protein [Escherichia albertii]EFO0970108.1 hypothetical protein [Escherichia albertii]EFO4718347.1 hypothetical protein [Escherichia albertii]UZM02468.1 hypothetical protein N6N74_08575 [Escherichia albertii]WKU83108.1 hypothetical protein MJ90_18985 [Escherichia albertii]
MIFANKISGNDTISIDSGTFALAGNNYAFDGYIDVAASRNKLSCGCRMKEAATNSVMEAVS